MTEGNIDIHSRPRVINKDCSVSTVRSITIEDDSGAVLLPTVGPDPKTGQPTVLSNDDAIAHYQKTGQHLGIFKTEDQANAYGEKLHQQQAKEYPDASKAECDAANAPAPEAAPASEPARKATPPGTKVTENPKSLKSRAGLLEEKGLLESELAGAQKTGKAVEIKHAQAKVDAVNEKLKTAK